MKVLILDGYVDEPACLGVPPFLSPYPRYLAGALITYGIEPYYATIDQFRRYVQNKRKGTDFQNTQTQMTQNKQEVHEYFNNVDILFVLSGVSVPGKYIGGHPINLNELKMLPEIFPNTIRILFGPATEFGIGIEGGKPPIEISYVEPFFNFIVHGNAHFTIEKYLGFDQLEPLKIKNMIDDAKGGHLYPGDISAGNANSENSNDQYSRLSEFAIKGAKIIPMHPNFGKNLICEIETFKGCPRYKKGGCSFCTETQKGAPIFREQDQIIQEIRELYEIGCVHFRLGNQTDFYSYKHGEYEKERYPKPNPKAIEYLLKGIRQQAPDLKTLHIDNVNALNFSLYEPEAIEITKLIAEYCTEGNIAAIGIESIDPQVIEKNNLKVQKDEAMKAVEIINRFGGERGPNGSPKFLPGLNFILGLPGETVNSMEMNEEFLKNILESGLMVRRINIRKMMAPKAKVYSKELAKNAKMYDKWKENIRNTIDNAMLKRCYPFGTVLKDCYYEYSQGGGSYLRQAGTYPILIYSHQLITPENENEPFDMIILNHGFRSLEGLVYPVNLFGLTLKQLESIPGIGKNTAVKIKLLKQDENEKLIELIGKDLFETLTGINQ